jgi:hypothetical protein
MALHLGSTHPLARVATGHCQDHSEPLLGGVACGRCWERAIRDDEHFATQNELPRELLTDPDLIDEIAVSRAVAGHRVTLTIPERCLAIGQLYEAGASTTEISRTLRADHTSIRREVTSQPASRENVGAA